jgi:hypothetical protein
LANDSPRRPYRVVLHGLPYFCQKLRNLIQSDEWEVRFRGELSFRGLAAHAQDAAWCDLAYTWGGRITMGKFLWVARCFRKKKIVILWSGSDVLHAREEFDKGRISPWVAEKTHWAVSPWVAEEVRSMCLPCEHVQVSFVPPVVNPPPLPRKFSVLLYVASVEKQDLYGWDRMIGVAEKLRSVDFTLVGLQQGQALKGPPNIRVHHRVDMLSAFRQATVIYRPVRHDGLSFMVLEALAHGRHVLYSYPLPGCAQVTSVDAACKELERLRELHESGALGLNLAGIELIRRDYDPPRVQARLLQRWKDVLTGPAPPSWRSRQASGTSGRFATLANSLRNQESNE